MNSEVQLEKSKLVGQYELPIFHSGQYPGQYPVSIRSVSGQYAEHKLPVAQSVWWQCACARRVSSQRKQERLRAAHASQLITTAIAPAAPPGTQSSSSFWLLHSLCEGFSSSREFKAPNGTLVLQMYVMMFVQFVP